METKRKTFLMLKQDLANTFNRLNFWVGNGDCYKWASFVYDNLTRQMLELHLGDPYTEYVILDG